jgi:hypothetical protein
MRGLWWEGRGDPSSWDVLSILSPAPVLFGRGLVKDLGQKIFLIFWVSDSLPSIFCHFMWGWGVPAYARFGDVQEGGRGQDDS